MQLLKSKGHCLLVTNGIKGIRAGESVRFAPFPRAAHTFAGKAPPVSQSAALGLSRVPWLQVRHQPHLNQGIQDSQEMHLLMKQREPKLASHQHHSSSQNDAITFYTAVRLGTGRGAADTGDPSPAFSPARATLNN